MSENNVVWHNGHITRDDRNALNRHNSGLVWFTGLPASGKSTIAHKVEEQLFQREIRCYVIDGDNVRHGINNNLGFSREDRRENLRRTAEIAKLFVDAGVLCLAAFISPHKQDREYIKSCFNYGEFIEVFVKCSIGECEKRDPKGHYKKARAGIIKDYTGVSAPYDVPEGPDLIVDTEKFDIGTSVNMVIELLERRGFIDSKEKVGAGGMICRKVTRYSKILMW